MSELTSAKQLRKISGSIPNLDQFKMVVMGIQTERYLAKKLLSCGSCAMMVNLGQQTALKLFFADMDLAMRTFEEEENTVMQWPG